MEGIHKMSDFQTFPHPDSLFRVELESQIDTTLKQLLYDESIYNFFVLCWLFHVFGLEK